MWKLVLVNEPKIGEWFGYNSCKFMILSSGNGYHLVVDNTIVTKSLSIPNLLDCFFTDNEKERLTLSGNKMYEKRAIYPDIGDIFLYAEHKRVVLYSPNGISLYSINEGRNKVTPLFCGCGKVIDLLNTYYSGDNDEELLTFNGKKFLSKR